MAFITEGHRDHRSLQRSGLVGNTPTGCGKKGRTIVLQGAGLSTGNPRIGTEANPTIPQRGEPVYDDDDDDDDEKSRRKSRTIGARIS